MSRSSYRVARHVKIRVCGGPWITSSSKPSTYVAQRASTCPVRPFCSVLSKILVDSRALQSAPEKWFTPDRIGAEGARDIVLWSAPDYSFWLNHQLTSALECSRSAGAAGPTPRDPEPRGILLTPTIAVKMYSSPPVLRVLVYNEYITSRAYTSTNQRCRNYDVILLQVLFQNKIDTHVHSGVVYAEV